jgi:hypothetical protein
LESFQTGLTKIRAADAKEVGVGNPAEETCCYPNIKNVTLSGRFVNLTTGGSWLYAPDHGAIFGFALPQAK